MQVTVLILHIRNQYRERQYFTIGWTIVPISFSDICFFTGGKQKGNNYDDTGL
jgi:hypothetical protein